MTYRFDATTVRTTAGQAWQGRHGVCQDMAHVMIAMCRARGLAARYVSGHLVGEGASHAWVEVHDEATGRPLAYDPTHGRRTDLRYVTVAVGRDYRDVAPTAGHYRSGPGARCRCARPSPSPPSADPIADSCTSPDVWSHVRPTVRTRRPGSAACSQCAPPPGTRR